jgi:hypothetical protein
MRSLLITLSIAVGLALPAAAAANVRSCTYPYGHGPRNDIGVQIRGVSVRDITCSAGLRAISNSRLLRGGSIATPGLYCYTLKRFIPAGYDQPLGANIRCVSGSRAFRFGWAT